MEEVEGDVAAELAPKDAEIDRLRNEASGARKKRNVCKERPVADESQCAWMDAELKAIWPGLGDAEAHRGVGHRERAGQGHGQLSVYLVHLEGDECEERRPVQEPEYVQCYELRRLVLLRKEACQEFETARSALAVDMSPHLTEIVLKPLREMMAVLSRSLRT